MKFIIAQILGGLVFLFFVLSINSKKKATILMFQIVANLIGFMQFVLLGAYTGAIMAIIGTMRLNVFYFFEKEKLKPNVLVLLVFSAIILVSGYYTYDDIYSLFPIVSMLFTGLILWQEDTAIIRLGSGMASVLWIIYNFFVGAYTGLVAEFVSIVVIGISYYKNEIKMKKSKISK